MNSNRPFVAFACAHLTDERLYAAQVAALGARYDTRVFVFRDHDSLGGMADELLANTPAHFTLVGLSLGGYVAFEIIRRQLPRVERLALLDTTAVADHEARKAGRLADIAKVREGGIDALIPELPTRWMLPAHATNPQLVALMTDMARSVGARGQFNQQTAMLARPDSHADLVKVRVPVLVMCGEQDPVTPVADHKAMAACIPGSRLEFIPECGHLSTIEQPQRVNAVLADWLDSTGSG
jgi:pimeloyl-ACP methyl ester carboxylesterase